MPFKPSRIFKTVQAFLALILVMGLGAVTLSCKEKQVGTPSANVEKNPSASLTGSDTVSSLIALADTVRLRALRGDTLGLLRLMVKDAAYRRHIWPTSSAFDSTREDAYRFVFGMHQANSAKGLRRMMFDVKSSEKSHPKTDLEFDSLPVPGGAIYSLKRTGGFRIFGSALRVGESFQVLSYSNSGSKGKTNQE